MSVVRHEPVATAMPPVPSLARDDDDPVIRGLRLAHALHAGGTPVDVALGAMRRLIEAHAPIGRAPRG